MSRTARIAQLRESIARRALTACGISTNTRILDVRRVRDTFIIATETPGDRWAPLAVETFHIPTPDNTDYYEPGEAPMLWTWGAGWISASVKEIPGLIDEATAYINRDHA